MGKVIGVVNDAAELDTAAAGEGEFFLIEFVDFRSGDGLYRKYRLWSFGGRTIFRHLVVTDNWNVHVSERLRFMRWNRAKPRCGRWSHRSPRVKPLHAHGAARSCWPRVLPPSPH